MSIGKKLTLLGIDVATTAVAPIADVITLGGVFTEDPEKGTMTGRAARKTLRDAEKLLRELEED